MNLIDRDILRYEAETCRETTDAFVELIDAQPTVEEDIFEKQVQEGLEALKDIGKQIQTELAIATQVPVGLLFLRDAFDPRKEEQDD